jgi:isopenicillin-N epimerase
VVASVPFPVHSPDEVVEAVLAAVTPQTRLALLDHVTSATAIRFPVEALVAALRERGVETLVDGAHAPGMIDLDVPALGATYYAANLHKWASAPKGAGFLWVHPAAQDRIRPAVISHGMNSPRSDRSRFLLEFDWTGTDDPSPWLASADAIRFGERLVPDGWRGLMERNHRLALAGRDLLCDALGIEPPAPDAMLGSMASVPLSSVSKPGTVQGVDLYADPVHAALLERGIQVMVTPWPQRPTGAPWRRLVRISAAAYNDLAHYQRLAAAIREVVTVASGSPV